METRRSLKQTKKSLIKNARNGINTDNFVIIACVNKNIKPTKLKRRFNMFSVMYIFISKRISVAYANYFCFEYNEGNNDGVICFLRSWLVRRHIWNPNSYLF